MGPLPRVMAFVTGERIGEARVFGTAYDDEIELVGLINRLVRRRTEGDRRELSVDGDRHVVRAERLLVLEERRDNLRARRVNDEAGIFQIALDLAVFGRNFGSFDERLVLCGNVVWRGGIIRDEFPLEAVDIG